MAEFVLSTGDRLPLTPQQERLVVLALANADQIASVARAIHRAECAKAPASDVVHRLTEQEILDAYWDQAEAATDCLLR